MSDQIDTRISPTLHPGIAGEIADYDDDTRPLLGATETVVHEAYQALFASGEADKIFEDYKRHVISGKQVLRNFE